MIYFDIEGNGFLHELHTIWCIVAKQNGIYYQWNIRGEQSPDTLNISLESMLSLLDSDTCVAHNGVMYDVPALEKMYDFRLKECVDTHILSRLSNPDREAHSLEYFGDILGFPKGDHTDFSKFSQEMLSYCIQDVNVLEKTYEYLQDEMSGWDWSQAVNLEHRLWRVQQKQEAKGVLFDKSKAEDLHREISSKVDRLTKLAVDQIPPHVVNGGELKKIFLKDGSYTEPVLKWMNM